VVVNNHLVDVAAKLGTERHDAAIAWSGKIPGYRFVRELDEKNILFE